MKNLTILPILLLLLNFTACKKDKDNVKEEAEKLGTYNYQGTDRDLISGDYRSGNGKGAWIYLAGKNPGDYVQIRFSALKDYEIPETTVYFNQYAVFVGGQAIVDNVADEFVGGKVTITRTNDQYSIKLTATTAKGAVAVNYEGSLKKI